MDAAARRGLGAALLALLLAVAAPIASAADAIRVASKLDTESALLGTMILKALNARGIATINKLRLGPTNILRRALVAGDIDIYPEYTGNGAIFHAMTGDPVWKDAQAGYDTVKALDAKQGITWLAPAPADNSWVIAVPRDIAAKEGLKSLADFARWVKAGGTVRLAASAEFVESPAALPALEAAYGFTLRRSQILTLAGGDTAVTMRAAAEHISGVNAAMAYGTDGALAVLGLVALSDPRQAEIVYAPAPVLRASVLAQHPEIGAALDPIFRSLDQATLQRLNAAISVDGRSSDEVAREYLKGKGLFN
jgi:osmoprotectant transport system substrate-binding protein